MILPVGNTTAMAAVVIAKKRRHIIQAFRQAGALTPDKAKSIAEVGLTESRLLQIQVRRGVLVEAAPGRYYLDAEREEQTAQTRRTLAFVALLTMLIIFLVGWFWGGK